MKVLHLIETLAVGGAEQMLINTLPALRARGIDIVVAVVRPPTDLAASFEAEDIPIIMLAQRHKWNLIGAVVELARIVRQEHIDIVHAHLYFPAIYTSLLKILRLTNVATTVSFHNLAYAKGVNPPGLGLTIHKALGSTLFQRGMDRKIAVSQAVADHYLKYLNQQDITVIYNTIDLQKIDRFHMQSLPEPNSPIHILVPGRLVKEKGHTEFINVVKLLSQQGHKFHVTFAGGGPLKESLHHSLTRNGLHGTVSITGVLDHAHMLEHMSQSDIIVVPSSAEGFGLVALEAMALGKPVVASAVGGLVELILKDRTGFIVPVADTQAMVSAIEILATNIDKRIKLGREARTRVETNFSLPASMNLLTNLYREILEDV